MKKLYFIVISLLVLSNSTLAQEELCVPDSNYIGQPAGVYPAPYHPTINPDGGILDTACINQAYKFVFTIVVPETIEFGGFEPKLDSVVILKNGILFAPQGIGYSCNPPNCNFKANTVGCLQLEGIPTDSNDPGIYDLKLNVKITMLSGLIVITDTLPDFLSDSAHYYLPLFEETSPYCSSSSVKNTIESDLDLIISPNPASDQINISFNAPSAGRASYAIVDLTGRELIKQDLRIESGQGYFTDNISMLDKGVYLFILELNGMKSIKKFTVH